MRRMSNIRKDFLASHLRKQIAVMRELLKDLEDDRNMEEVYLRESLRKVETSLHQLAKISVCN